MTRIFLVEPNQLFREGLRRLLQAQDCVIVGEASLLRVTLDPLAAAEPADLLVFDFAADEDCGAIIEQVRFVRPSMKLVVLSGTTTRKALGDAIGWAVDSYLLKDMSAETLARSFQLIMLGQQLFPTRLMLEMQAGVDDAGSDIRTRTGLSPRELQILRGLMGGKSNKAIARDLAITEATVKVHLKALLRKVRVNNRTQAAVWALSKGLEQIA
jgi:two-component system, NarL family, nitrate/nitrite response regulator NarL